MQKNAVYGIENPVILLAHQRVFELGRKVFLGQAENERFESISARKSVIIFMYAFITNSQISSSPASLFWSINSITVMGLIVLLVLVVLIALIVLKVLIV